MSLRKLLEQNPLHNTYAAWILTESLRRFTTSAAKLQNRMVF